MATTEQLEALKDAPYNAVRIRVTDAEGKERWRTVPGNEGKEKDVLRDDDTFKLKNDGSFSFMKSAPGTRAVAKRTPTNDLARAIVKDKADHFKQDALMRAVTDNPESTEVLYATIRAVATECSSLEFERHEKERKGEDTTMISNRRIAALTKIGDTWLKRMDQVMAKGIDLQSPAFGAVFGFIMQTMRDSLEGTDIPPDRIQLAFTKFSQRVEDDSWFNEARAKMKAVT